VAVGDQGILQWLPNLVDFGDKWRMSEGEAEGCKMAMWGLQ